MEEMGLYSTFKVESVWEEYWERAPTDGGGGMSESREMGQSEGHKGGSLQGRESSARLSRTAQGDR